MKNNFGLDLVYEADPSNTSARPTSIVDIVFVHGFGGHPFDTWTAPDSDTFWPRDFIPLGIPNARIFTYGYECSIESFVTPKHISVIAEGLLSSLAEQRQPPPKGRLPLIFIAHGLGGLIVKAALLLSHENHHHNREIIDSTGGIVSLGAPHLGGGLESISRVLHYFASASKGENDLNPRGSRQLMVSTLLRIQTRFEGLLRQNIHRFQLISFLEEFSIPSFGQIVEEHLEPDSPYTTLHLHADHSNICKFTEILEPSYQLVLGELKKAVAQIYSRKWTSPRVIAQDHPFHPQGDNGSDRIASPLADTCDWIFNHKEFTSWMSASRPSVFWCHGSPGSGKSVLSKCISRHLAEEKLEGTTRVLGCFFFNWRSGAVDGHPTRFLRSLLNQIYSQCSSDMSDLILSKSDQQIEPSMRGQHTLSPHLKSKSLLDILEASLWRISEHQSVFIIIDALDEISESEITDVWSVLSFLHTSKPKHRIKLWMTSRSSHESVLGTLRFPNLHKITLEDENAGGIERFLRLKMKHLVRGHDDEREEFFIKTLSEKAAGVFLWVSFAVTELIQRLERGLDRTEALDLLIPKFPSHLTGLYRATLDRITRNGRYQQSQAMLACLCFARRPLTILELQYALSFKFTYKTKISLQVPPIDEDWLLTHFGGFLKIEDPGQQVLIVHNTAHEFLIEAASSIMSDRIEERLPYPQSVHYWFAELCIVCIRFSHYTAKAHVKGEQFQAQSNNFLDYAVSYWPEHLKLADTTVTVHLNILESLDWPSTGILGHWAYLHQKRIGDATDSEYWGWTALHISAAFGIHSLALTICRAGSFSLTRLDAGDAKGRTPLSLAARQRHVDLVKLFISTGADVNKKDIRYGLSPLQWAILGGHRSVVAVLLESGAEVNNISLPGFNIYSTPLSVAAARGELKIAELLLNYGADPNLVDPTHGLTALHLAARYGHSAVVELLIQSGACLHVEDIYRKQTPLLYAISGGHLDVVRSLTEHGWGIKQRNVELAKNIPVSWAHRIAFSMIGPVDDTTRISKLTLRECPNSNSKSANTSSSVPSKRARDSDAPAGSAKRIHNVPGSEGGKRDGGSGDDPNRPPTLGSTPPSFSNGPSRRLACPYFKFAPERYGSPSRCAGPYGWPDVNRLKEHLYKSHFLNICQKCNHTFDDREKLEEHHQLVAPCPLRRARDYGEGFDETQKDKLKSRTGKREAGGTELKYWDWVYKILFPISQGSPIPKNPFYDEENMDKKAYDDLCAHMRSRSYDLRRDIFRAINDPGDSDQVATILALINDHQVRSVNLPSLQTNNPAINPIRTSQPPTTDLIPNSQFMPSIGVEGRSFVPLGFSSWNPAQDPSESDSGFYSVNWAPNKRDSLLLPSQQGEYSEGSEMLTAPSDLVEAQSVQNSATLLEMGYTEEEGDVGISMPTNFDIDFDQFLDPRLGFPDAAGTTQK